MTNNTGENNEIIAHESESTTSKDKRNFENRLEISSRNVKNSVNKNDDHEFINNQTATTAFRSSTDGQDTSMKTGENEIGVKANNSVDKKAISNRLLTTEESKNGTEHESGTSISKDRGNIENKLEFSSSNIKGSENKYNDHKFRNNQTTYRAYSTSSDGPTTIKLSVNEVGEKFNSSDYKTAKINKMLTDNIEDNKKGTAHESGSTISKDKENLENTLEFSSNNLKSSEHRNDNNKFSKNQTINSALSTSTDEQATSIIIHGNETGEKGNNSGNNTRKSDTILTTYTEDNKKGTEHEPGPTLSIDKGNLENNMENSSSNVKGSENKYDDNKLRNNQTTYETFSSSTDRQSTSIKLSVNEVGEKINSSDKKTVKNNKILTNNTEENISFSTTSKNIQSSSRSSVAEQEQKNENVSIRTKDEKSLNSKGKNSTAETSNFKYEDTKASKNKNLSGEAEDTTSKNNAYNNFQMLTNTSIKSTEKGTETEKGITYSSETTTATTAITKRNDFSFLALFFLLQ
jgi:hypothetical protein